jgi:3-oxoacyl-[acyl-carrier-protein] synthase II
LKENAMPSNHDSAGRPIVVVTGMGVVTSLGAGKADNWKHLTAGKSGIKTISRFATDGLKTRFAGTVDFIPADPLSAPELSERLADMAAAEAIGESGVGSRGDFPGPLFLAVPPVEIEWAQRRELAAASGANANVSYNDLIRTAASGTFKPHHDRFMFGSVANNLADKFGTKGSPISLSTACASGATAIQLGVEAIRRGEASAALCIGSDGSINPESLIRFSLLSALSTSMDPPEQAAKPFAKNRDGFVMAEGAGALVLESLESARARGAKILGVLEGCGEMADSFHRTRSSPDGKPIVGCIRNALADAGLAPDAIDYINPHGTGTPENDKMEAMGVMAVFGERAKSIPMSSNKSMIGHTLSAAGAVEAVFSLLTLQHQRIPPTINYHVPDPAIPLDVVPNEARDATVRHVISSSFGFGGQNVSLVMGREPA